MEFEEALKIIKDGGKVTNLDWCDEDIFLFRGKMWNHNMGKPIITEFIAINDGKGRFAPYTPTQFDLFGKKWKVIEYEEPEELERGYC